MNRNPWLLLAALSLAAIATQYLVWINRDRTDEHTYAGPPRSDYTLTGFTLDALDTDGRRTFQVSGPHLARRGDDGSIFVTTPDYELLDGAGNPWKGKSDSAWVNKDGSVMKLLGHVEMHRQGGDKQASLDLLTRDLTTWPKQRRMETAAEATITQPGSILRGVGLRGDLNEKTLELLSDVESTIEPKPRRK